MSNDPSNGILMGTWTYRSFINNPDLSVDFDTLEFGRGNIRIDAAPMNQFKGSIYGPGWELDLAGSTTYGNPFTVRALAYTGAGHVIHHANILRDR